MTLDHLVREPAGEPAGALILNHGRGTDERDLYDLIDVLDPERRLVGITPGAPLTNIPPGGRHCASSRGWGIPTRDLRRELPPAERVPRRDAHGPRAVVGPGAARRVLDGRDDVLRGRPRRGRPSPAGILAMSAFIPTVEGWSADLDGRRGLPVMIHHGTQDPIIEVGAGRAANETLTSRRPRRHLLRDRRRALSSARAARRVRAVRQPRYSRAPVNR